ncbi:MAG: hypothetical protein KVP17_000448 [Porospora cf. gigantea B]|uniref:uncharacterized protein n=1 Tax=Porospora cf. gigantea B TaxID=2853592 RepID=UPI0035718F27|nr:MAG: hypothetical protein KVP17_000448 [Porospora cf. gigantea B]
MTSCWADLSSDSDEFIPVFEPRTVSLVATSKKRNPRKSRRDDDLSVWACTGPREISVDELVSLQKKKSSDHGEFRRSPRTSGPCGSGPRSLTARPGATPFSRGGSLETLAFTRSSVPQRSRMPKAPTSGSSEVVDTRDTSDTAATSRKSSAVAAPLSAQPPLSWEDESSELELVDAASDDASSVPWTSKEDLSSPFDGFLQCAEFIPSYEHRIQSAVCQDYCHKSSSGAPGSMITDASGLTTSPTEVGSLISCKLGPTTSPLVPPTEVGSLITDVSGPITSPLVPPTEVTDVSSPTTSPLVIPTEASSLSTSTVGSSARPLTSLPVRVAAGCPQSTTMLDVHLPLAEATGECSSRCYPWESGQSQHEFFAAVSDCPEFVPSVFHAPAASYEAPGFDENFMNPEAAPFNPNAAVFTPSFASEPLPTTVKYEDQLSLGARLVSMRSELSCEISYEETHDCSTTMMVLRDDYTDDSDAEMVEPMDLWYDSPLATKAGPLTTDQYKTRLLKMGTLHSLEAFWTFQDQVDWDNLPRKTTIALTRCGVQPIWEDPEHLDGGRIIIWGLKKADTAPIFVSLCLNLFHSNFPEGDKITTISCSSQPNCNVSVWVSSYPRDPEELCSYIFELLVIEQPEKRLAKIVLKWESNMDATSANFFKAQKCGLARKPEWRYQAPTLALFRGFHPQDPTEWNYGIDYKCI